MQKKLQGLQKSLRDNQAEQKTLSKEIKDADKEIKQIEKTIAKTGTTTEEQRKRLEQLRHTIETDRASIEGLKLQEAQLRSQIEDTNKRIEEERKALADLKTSMGDTKTAAGDLTKEVAAIGAAATAAVAGLFAFTKDAAQWADDINTLSKVTGISTAELQKFTYATNLIDVSVDTLSGSLTKLTRNMAEPSKTAAAAFNTLSISVRDTAGQLRDRETVFYEVIDALSKVGNEVERDALCMDIFGKSAQQLNPLIKGGAEALKEIGDRAERAGLILSQETLNGLNAFNDKVDELKAKGTAIKELAAAEMTPALEGLVEVGDELLKEIQKMVQSGELKSMAKELGQAIKAGAEGLKNIISFVWQYKEAIGAAVAGMVAFKAGLSIGKLITALVAGFKALSVATKSETTAMAALNTVMNANPIGIVIGTVAALTAAFITLAATTGENTQAIKNYNEELDSLLKKQSEAEAGAVAEGKKVELLKDEYDRLREKTNLTVREKERFATVCEQLAGKLGITTEELKTQAGAYRDLTQEVSKHLDKLKEQAKYDYYSDIITESAKAAAQIEADLEVAEKARQAFLDGNMKAYQEYVQILKDQGHNVGVGGFIEMEALINQLNKQLEKSREAADRAAEAYKRLGQTGELTGSILLGLKAAFAGITGSTEGYKKAIEDAEKKLEELAKEEKNLQSQSSSLRSEMNSLANSLKQLENGETLSLNTLLDLISKYPEYAAELIKARDNADLQRKALELLFEAKKQEYILSLERAAKVSNASNEETAIVLENLANQIEAYNKLGTTMGNVALAAVVANSVVVAALRSQAQDLRNTVKNYQDEINFVKNLSIGDFVSGSGSSGGSGDSGTSNRKTINYTREHAGETYTTSYSYEKGKYNVTDAVDAQAKAYLGVWERAKSFGKMTLSEEIGALQSLLKWEQLSADQRYDIRLKLYKAQQELAKKNADAEKEASEAAQKAAEEANKALLDRQNLALAAYNKLVNGKIDALEAESKAAQDSADKQIAAIDALMKKRKEESEDAKRQQELAVINAKLSYQQMDNFTRHELERRRQDILNEQYEVDYSRNIEAQKAAINAGAVVIQDRNAAAIAGLQASQTQAADRIAYVQGNQSYDQRVANNSKVYNIQIVRNGFTDDQLIQLANKTIKELG